MQRSVADNGFSFQNISGLVPGNMQPGGGMPFLENIGIDARKRELLEARFIPGDKVGYSKLFISN